LYHLNEQRLQVPRDSAAFAPRERDLRQAVAALQRRGHEELAAPGLHPARAKALASLQEHWEGLTLFVEHPQVPMDNNAAERAERGPVVGRKNYYGSGALWSGRLAALRFSVLQTLRRWGLNPRRWLTA
jgi:transposase